MSKQRTMVRQASSDKDSSSSAAHLRAGANTAVVPTAEPRGDQHTPTDAGLRGLGILALACVDVSTHWCR